MNNGITFPFPPFLGCPQPKMVQIPPNLEMFQSRILIRAGVALQAKHFKRIVSVWRRVKRGNGAHLRRLAVL